ncbi:hypothetical protein OF83DRAFT_1138482 [Amylostereum chailletii]|nr:hypothetical protein OF83DRAFT_1138482 [Amylostereum chailletii]
MHIRYHAQRQHIIDSLESLLYQLHVLSYFMAPSLLALVTRSGAQFQLSRPRTVDAQRSLRFWYILILLFNVGSVWTHATKGVPEGRAVIVDFVGMYFTPTRIQLLMLDFTIIALSFAVTTIAYETSCTLASPANIPDPLAPSSLNRPATFYEPVANASDGLAIDLRMSLFIKHILHPPPPPAERQDDNSPLLPLPNTAAALPRSLRLLMQTRAARRTRAQDATARPGGTSEEGQVQGRVPGAMDPE